MALRCMNPQYIICDELGTAADAAALEEGIASGRPSSPPSTVMLPKA